MTCSRYCWNNTGSLVALDLHVTNIFKGFKYNTAYFAVFGKVAHYSSESFIHVHPNLWSSLAIKFLYTNWEWIKSWKKTLPVHTNCSLKRTTHVAYRKAWIYRGSVLTLIPAKTHHSPLNFVYNYHVTTWLLAHQLSLLIWASSEHKKYSLPNGLHFKIVYYS